MSNINIFEINSELSEVKLMAAHFQTFCSINMITKGDSGLLELVFVEAVNNIIIHAYDSLSGFKINAQYELSDSQVIITLSDSGKEFKNKKEMDETRKTEETGEELDGLAEGNWGIDLMKSIADDVIRYRKDNINTLIIKKKIDT